MPLFNRDDYTPPDHLRVIFGEFERVQVSRGELERLRAVDREATALRDLICPSGSESNRPPLATTLITGDVLAGLFALL